MKPTSSKKEVPYIAHSEFSGNYYLVTKAKDNVPVDKTDITQQIESLVKSELSQALKELKEEVIGEVPSKINTDNWKYDRRVVELKLWQHQAIDNKIKALEEV